MCEESDRGKSGYFRQRQEKIHNQHDRAAILEWSRDSQITVKFSCKIS